MAASVGPALGPGCGTVFGDVMIEMGVEACGSCEELFAGSTLEAGIRGRHIDGVERGAEEAGGDGDGDASRGVRIVGWWLVTRRDCWGVLLLPGWDCVSDSNTG